MLSDLINEIAATGFSEAEIARVVKCSQPTINRIRRGRIKDSRYSLAKALECLHAVRCIAAGAVGPDGVHTAT